ncbi:MAG: hypothetical protein H6923_08720 [Alphaproteobacteria bacterium]|nr:hypothetical protein [Alphaproteobacteria bacterium]
MASASSSPSGPLVDYGYEATFFLFVPVTVAPDATGDLATVTALATWLVCEGRYACPRRTRLSLDLAIGPAAIADRMGARESRLAADHHPIPRLGRKSLRGRGQTAIFWLDAPEAQRGSVDLAFFAETEGAHRPGSPAWR